MRVKESRNCQTMHVVSAATMLAIDAYLRHSRFLLTTLSAAGTVKKLRSGGGGIARDVVTSPGRHAVSGGSATLHENQQPSGVRQISHSPAVQGRPTPHPPERQDTVQLWPRTHEGTSALSLILQSTAHGFRQRSHSMPL